MENKKLAAEEVTALRGLQARSTDLSQQLGSFEMQRLGLEMQRKAAEEAFVELREEEIKLGKELFEKYGNGNIDIDKGEFVPAAQ